MRKLTPYQRIVRNAMAGRKVVLSRDEVRAMSRDNAIETVAWDDDTVDVEAGRKAGTELKGPYNR